MIKDFVEKWNKNKNKLEEYFSQTKQSEYFDYKSIVKALFEKVINDDGIYESEKFDTDNIFVIDDGDYQGTQIFILSKNVYQPNVKDYVYTNTYYGSCSGCDTLLAIQDCDTEKMPSKNQVEGYMLLALHLLQECKFMEEED